MKKYFQVCKSHPIAALLFIVCLGLYTGLNATAFYASLEDMSGTYVYAKNNIKLQLSGSDGDFSGDLIIGSNSYPVTAKQTSTGLVNGVYSRGEKDFKFSLQQSYAQFFLPASHKTARLTAAGKSWQMRRPAAQNVNLSGEWTTVGAKLLVEASEAGGWRALLTQDDGNKSVLEFDLQGTTLKGVTGTDNGANWFNGEYVYKRDRLKLRIKNENLVFARNSETEGEVAHFKAHIKAFDGVFSDGNKDGYSVTIFHRQSNKVNGANTTTHHICEGEVRKAEKVWPLLSCGIEQGELWMNYRIGTPDNPNFGVAYAKLTAQGISLRWASKKYALSRLLAPLVAGRYQAKGLSLTLNSLQDDIWSGVVKRGEQSSPFKGRFTANQLEAVYLDDDDRAQSFVVASSITSATLSMADGKPQLLKLTLASANQPHAPKQRELVMDRLKQWGRN